LPARELRRASRARQPRNLIGHRRAHPLVS